MIIYYILLTCRPFFAALLFLYIASHQVYGLSHHQHRTQATTKGSEILARKLIMARAGWFTFAPSMAITVFPRLAISAVTQDPRRPIRWVCSAFCFTIASLYLSHLHLLSKKAVSSVSGKWSVVWGCCNVPS